VPSLLGLSFLVFSLVRLVPGDYVLAMLDQVQSLEDINKARHALGLDRPWLSQYFAWLWGVLRGDLGTSFWSGEPVAREILHRLPVTMELALLALLVSVLISVPAAVLAILRRGRWPDLLARFLSFAGLAVPHFWLATLALLYSAIWWNWIPPLSYVHLTESPLANLEQFALPALVLGIGLAARTLRLTRSSLLEVMAEDYVRTARAKGVAEGRVVWRHALRNALIPVVTVVGTQFSYLLGGTVVIEVIFAMPGIGRLMVDSVTQRDYPQLQGNVLAVGTLVLLVNLLTDLTYGLIDPRVRPDERRSGGGKG